MFEACTVATWLTGGSGSWLWLLSCSLSGRARLRSDSPSGLRIRYRRCTSVLPGSSSAITSSQAGRTARPTRRFRVGQTASRRSVLCTRCVTEWMSGFATLACHWSSWAWRRLPGSWIDAGQAMACPSRRSGMWRSVAIGVVSAAIVACRRRRTRHQPLPVQRHRAPGRAV